MAGSQGVVNGAARDSASSSTLLELVADMVADKKAKRKSKSPAVFEQAIGNAEPPSKKAKPDILDAQRSIAEKKEAASDAAAPGKPTQYVGSRGETWQARSHKADKEVAVLLSSSAALPLKVYFKKEVKKLKDIFRQAPTIADADVVVVHDIFE